MSYKNSNLYASRVYAEHPIAMWSMDEEYFFFSLISENEKLLSSSESNWIFTNAASSLATDIFTIPIDEDPTVKIYLTSASSRYAEIQLASPISYEDSIDEEKGSVSISTHVNIPQITNVSKIQIGFLINSQYSYKEFSNLLDNFWEFLSFTKQLDSEEDIVPLIKIFYKDDNNFGEQDSSIYFNGISVGQWSEAYSFKNTGVQPQELPLSVFDAIPYSVPLKGLKLDAYGFNDLDNAYVIQERKRLLVEKVGIPMVYGSEGNISILSKDVLNIFEDFATSGDPSTLIFDEYFDGNPTYEESIEGGSSIFFEEEIIDGGSSSTSETIILDGGASSLSYFENILDGGDPTYLDEDKFIPSIIFPGKGFLNLNGKYQNLTVEFWMRISHESNKELKIFGPTKSSDGLYVSGEFLTLKVGKYRKSYFINQWYRPMLVHISQSKTELFVMINGEKVISIDIDFEKIDTLTNYSEDYLGFYGSEKISLFELDCFSIFPYIVSEQVAKKRYVFGQGVQEQENIVVPFGGQLSYVDFPYSGYSSTVRYPDRTSWTDGYYNNVVADSEGISLPSYNVPEIIFTSFNNSTYTDLLQQEKRELFEIDNFSIQDEEYPFISMNPNTSYEGVNATIEFSTINQSTYTTKSVSSVLKTSSDIETEQSLIYIYNNSNTNTFNIVLSSGSIHYLFNNESLKSMPVSADEYVSIGIDFDKISKDYSSTVGSFFLSTEKLSLNFANNQNNKFLGKIFSLTFNNDFFAENDRELIFGTEENYDGFATLNVSEQLFNYVGTYTLLPKISNSTVFLDVGCSGYWENSTPLSYFGKYITTSTGDRVYDLDMLQFNVDIPSSVFSKYNSQASEYQSKMLSKVYVSIQNNVKTPKAYSEYVNTENIGIDRVLDFNEVEDFDSTKFEICDSTVIYPPKSGIGFANYSLVTYIIITSKGVNSENVKIKNMSLSSLTFDESEFYSINTPAVGKFYPITKSQDQYVYKRQIPVVIDNETSPYLYLSGDSGLSVLPKSDGNLLKGFSIPVNQSLKPVDNIVGFQMFLMFNEEREFSSRKVIGKIFSNLVSYDIVLVPESDKKRAFIKMYDSYSKREVQNLRFFLNGTEVSTIAIKPLAWNFITVSFQESSISIDGKLGQFEIYSGIKVDNVAVFSEISTTKAKQFNYDSWNQAFDEYDYIEEEGGGPESWAYWSASVGATPNTWEVPLDPQESSVQILSIDGNAVFDTYAGLSSFIGDDSSTISVNFDSVKVLNDVTWDTFEIKPT
jgi:hypothetical protein